MLLTLYLMVGLILITWVTFLPISWQHKTAFILLSPVWPALAAVFCVRALDSYKLRKLGP